MELSATSGMDLNSLMAAMRETMIAKLDLNEDGSIDKSELGEVSKSFSQKASEWVAKCDENQDGSLSEDEALGKIEALDGLRIERIQQIIFSFLDHNEDGAIDEDDVTGITEEFDQMIADVFDSSDTNRDEVLSPEELDGLLAAGSPELPLPPPPPEELAKQAEAPDDLGANALLAMLNAMRGREDDEIQSVLMGV